MQNAAVDSMLRWVADKRMFANMFLTDMFFKLDFKYCLPF